MMEDWKKMLQVTSCGSEPRRAHPPTSRFARLRRTGSARLQKPFGGQARLQEPFGGQARLPKNLFGG
jgi:hypothetical protein